MEPILMVEFKTKIYYENTDGNDNPNIIGAEVTVYSAAGDNIGSIQVTSKKDFDDLVAKLENLDETYLLKTSLESEVKKLDINAATLGGKSSTDFALNSHTHDDRYFTETEINNKLNWKSLEGLPTGVKLYYNELFCILELNEYVKLVSEPNQNWVNLSITIPNQYLPMTDASGNVHNQNAQMVVFKDNGTSNSRVQYKKFNGNINKNKITVSASAIWRRK